MNDVAQQTAGNWANGTFWVIVVFIGAFALFGAMMWARRKNKNITHSEHRRSEQATKDLYQDPVEHDRHNP